MAKFCGVIGYGEAVENPPGSGVYVDTIIERKRYGDVIRNTRRLQEDGTRLNDDITVGNSISIVADAYDNEHFFAIRYLGWAGTLWKVANVDVQRPRLILELGGMYNGPTAPSVAKPV